MNFSKSASLESFKSKKIPDESSKSAYLSSSAQTQVPPPPDRDALSTKTPEKPTPRRTRNRGVALSLKDVKKVAEGLRQSSRSDFRLDSTSSRSNVSSARKPMCKAKNVDGGSIKLPQKHEMLVEFFNSLDSSVRLLRLKGLKSTFTNICPKIESLTDRRFSYAHLAQLKFILPEVILLKKVLVRDERTSCMKPDLHVTLEADAVENEEKLKSGSGHMHLRKVFRARLLDFLNANPEVDEIPEETLPEPFTRLKQDLHSKIVKTSKPSFAIETSTDALLDQKLSVASHLPQTFRRHFSQKVSRLGAGNSPHKPSHDSLHSLEPPVQEPILNKASSDQEAFASAVASPTKFFPNPIARETSTPFKAVKSSPSSLLSSPLPATPSKDPNSSKIEEIGRIQSTPAKLTSTPAKLITSTPALQSPKRCHMSPDDHSNKSPNKLVRRALRTRSLKFDSPVKASKSKDEVNKIRCSSFNGDILDILPDNLLQSIMEKERKALEERDPAITQAKRRREILGSLPKLFNMIHLLVQSINRSVITKEELIHKIIAGHCDVIDRREIEEQFKLLQELVPDWISENVASSGDRLLRINKTLAPESIRARLAEAK